MTDSGSEHPLDLVPLPGSDRPSPTALSPASVEISSDTVIEATIILRRRAPMSTEDAVGQVRTSARLAAEFGADPSDVSLVESTLRGLGLRIIATDAASRRIRIAGSVAIMSRVFGTSLSVSTTSAPDGAGFTSHRVRTGGLSVPAALAGAITAVLGLDNRPQARPQFRVSSSSASSVSYTPLQLGDLYGFPAGTDGSGQPSPSSSWAVVSRRATLTPISPA
ncbi:MAG TPA: protease pro-enzyme activation domain-containing protein [Galbitalea sp.]|jgi:kumamolisin|nr:protease pro-enzyme activation domain-containing protein [Galbitalea sp.]